MKRLTLPLLLGLAVLGTSASAQSRDDDGTSCPDSRTQTGMNYCAARDYAEADRDLNVMWPHVLTEMRRIDAARRSSRADGRPSYLQAMLRGQRAWIVWRDAHCVSEGYGARGGSMEPLLISQCLTRLTRERIEQLAMIVEDRN